MGTRAVGSFTNQTLNYVRMESSVAIGHPLILVRMKLKAAGTSELEHPHYVLK